MRIFFLIVLFCSLSLNSVAQFPPKSIEDLDQVFQEMIERGYMAGFGVSVFTKDKVLYQKGFGYSDRENKIPYTSSSRQILASVSKTTIAIALMKAQEMGLLKLDDPINKHLPFKVANSFFPMDPITLRHLATHTSSLKYSQMMTDHHAYENPDMDLEDCLRAFMIPSGKWYNENNFHQIVPGQRADYSNMGADLAAYVIECVAKMSFSHFTKVYIFEPLKMESTDWYKGPSEQDIVKHYKFITKGQIEEFPRVKNSMYPDGDLVSNVEDLTRYCQAMMKQGQLDGNRILSESSMKEMMKFSKKKGVEGDKGNISIFWNKNKNELSIPRKLIGHNGGDTGMYSMMFFDPKKEIGYILLCNTDKADYYGKDGYDCLMTLGVIYKGLYLYAKHVLKQTSGV